MKLKEKWVDYLDWRRYQFCDDRGMLVEFDDGISVLYYKTWEDRENILPTIYWN